jgi:hypothetical protein
MNQISCFFNFRFDMNYKTEMKKFRSFDISNKRIFLIYFFDDIRFNMDSLFLLSSFKHKKEDSEQINEFHNKLAETVCYKELGSLDGRKIIYFIKNIYFSEMLL